VSHWFDGVTYTVRHGLLIGMKRQGGLGFLPIRTVETPETRFFRALDLTGQVVYDVGGFEGLLTLFFAVRATEVVVYEPNPASRMRLERNLALNGVSNVTIRPVGAGAVAGEYAFVYDPLMPGAASADPAISHQIRETAGRLRTLKAPLVTIDADRIAHQLPVPTFIKIDVEGLELDVLRGLANTISDYHPALFIELHGADAARKSENAVAVVRWLIAAGYRSILNVETGKPESPESASLRPAGHLYCTK
jgi:FkbM family methyltransferase